MNEMFSKTVMACAAITSCLAGGAAIVNGATSLIDARVTSVLVAREQLASENLLVEVVDTAVKGAKKLIK